MKAICSHGRSYLYFTESIRNSISRNCTFWAHPWDRSTEDIEDILIQSCHKETCSEMGINSHRHTHKGSFFALTSATLPYCCTFIFYINNTFSTHICYFFVFLNITIISLLILDSGLWNREQVAEIINYNYNDTDVDGK